MFHSLYIYFISVVPVDSYRDDDQGLITVDHFLTTGSAGKVTSSRMAEIQCSYLGYYYY